MPRGAKRTLRYLHHAGIGVVLRKFGGMPGVRSAWSLSPRGKQKGFAHQQRDMDVNLTLTFQAARAHLCFTAVLLSIPSKSHSACV